MKEIIKLIINEWKEKSIPEAIDRQNGLSRYIGIRPKKIIVVTGFRRTGKTFLLYHLIKKNIKKEEAVYINFEDERIPLKTEFLTGIFPVIKQTYKKQPVYLLLDEIHNIPLWSKWVRRVYDNEEINIFVTGSSSKMSSNEIPTELRGRYLERAVFPLSFKEFILFKGKKVDLDNINHSENEKGKMMLMLDEYIELGGMPEVVLADENKKADIIHSYYNTVIRRDLIERFKIKNEESLKALLRMLLNSTAYSISKSYNTLKGLNLKIGKGTIQRYLAYIHDSYFLHSLEVFSYKVKDRLQHPRKIYFIDNGFIALLSSNFSKNTGRLYENTVFLEFKRRMHEQGYELFYWKNLQKEEVDFVVKEGLKVTLLAQVCCNLEDYDTKKREIRALLKASKELGCDNLLIITKDKEGEEIAASKKIKYVPLWKWLLE